MTKARSRSDGEATRRRIFATALSLFHDRGFEATTMRDVARAAGVSLGAAYHYFDSKQAIAAEYYAERHREHERALTEALPQAESLRDRIALAMHLGLDVRVRDRPLMRELAPLAIGNDAALSAFSPALAELRKSAIAMYRAAVEDPGVPEDVREPLALALWALQFGVYLYFVNDESPRQRKTRALVDGAIDLTMMLLPLIALPPMQPVRAKLNELLETAGLSGG